MIKQKTSKISIKDKIKKDKLIACEIKKANDK
jgi:hypothetical protein